MGNFHKSLQHFSIKAACLFFIWKFNVVINKANFQKTLKTKNHKGKIHKTKKYKSIDVLFKNLIKLKNSIKVFFNFSLYFKLFYFERLLQNF